MISNAKINCFIDSATLVACWNKDGSRNTSVNNALKEVFHLTLSANLQVILQFVPSQQNPADSPFRIPSDRDCSLSPAFGSLYNEHLAHTPLILWLPLSMSRKILLVGLSFFCTLTLTSGSRRQCFLGNSVSITQCVCVSSVRACWPPD